MPEFVSVRREEAVAVVTLEREAKLNAISAAVEASLCRALSDPVVRDAAAVVITGGSRVFSAGADVTEFGGLTPADIMGYYRGTGDFAERVADLPQPTFSAIEGWCLGGGLELALATDFRIASADAVFGLPEVGLGILPSSGGTHRLVRALGAARAKELALLRERVSAAEALRLGLITDVVDPGEAVARAVSHAARVADLPGLAVRVTKRVIDVMAESSRAAGLELERLAYGLLAQTPEADTAAAEFGR
jgi:enoyl-CoA hydratase/carnithine racemase